MSNTDKNKPAPASSTAAPAVSAPAKPPASNETLVSAGNGAAAPASAATPSTGAAADEADESGKIQYYVIVGKVETFSDVREAEKFLNAPDAPQCMVIYGKVSLVNEWHITTGVLHSFKSLVKAQKFLKNSPAIKDFVMVRGRVTHGCQ